MLSLGVVWIISLGTALGSLYRNVVDIGARVEGGVEGRIEGLQRKLFRIPPWKMIPWSNNFIVSLVP